MTELLILAVIIALLVLALEPAHRRLAGWGSRPGQTHVIDRDQQRLVDELRTRAPERQLKLRRRLPVLHVRRHHAV